MTRLDAFFLSLPVPPAPESATRLIEADDIPLTTEQVAARLGIPNHTVKHIQTTAIAKMRRRLALLEGAGTSAARERLWRKWEART